MSYVSSHQTNKLTGVGERETETENFQICDFWINPIKCYPNMIEEKKNSFEHIGIAFYDVIAFNS